MANYTSTQLRNYSWMAQAAYLDFSLATPRDDVSLKNVLLYDIFYEDSLFAEKQATLFTDPTTGYKLISHKPDQSSGLSATVFLSAKDSTYTIAVRGTDPKNQKWEDLIMADALGVVAQGTANDQLFDAYRYYKQLTATGSVFYSDKELTAMATLLVKSKDGNLSLGALTLGPVVSAIASWATGMTFASRVQSMAAALKQEFSTDQALNLIPANAAVNFTGHSLGGHVAALLAEMVASFQGNSAVGDIVTYNAPATNALPYEVANWFGIPTTVQSGILGEKHLTVIGEAGAEVTAGLGQVNGTKEWIFIEEETGVPNHSIVKLSDSLALYDIFKKLSSELKQSEIKEILSASSYTALNSLERGLDVLRAIFLGQSALLADKTPQEDRAKYYANLYALQDNSDYKNLLGQAKIESLTSQSADDIANLAKNGDINAKAYRYALKAGSPFVLLSLPSLYDKLNTAGELDLYNEATGEGELTNEWITDRSKLLAWMIQANTEDKTGISDGGSEQWAVEDKTLKGASEFLPYSLDINAGLLGLTGNARKMIFGKDQTDGSVESIAGGENDDRLYGGGGDDSLDGGKEDDYIEGNSGDDTLQGGEGSDMLLGGSGSGNDTLNGGSGNDLLQGGSGNDTYTFTGDYGIDIVTDSDGSGSIQVDGQSLGGGTQTFDSVYKNEASGQIFVKLNDGKNLVILKEDNKNRILVNDWPTAGTLGITLQDKAPETPAATMTGDFKKMNNGNIFIIVGDNYAKDGDEANALDMITGTAGADVIDGGGGDDALSGKAGDDVILGGAGGDAIQGGLDKDTLYGGAGDDAIYGSSDDAFQLTISANWGKPLNKYPHPQATGFNWTSGYYDTIADGVPNTISDEPRNRLDRDQGNIIDGGIGNDFIAAGTGADVVHGGADNDYIFGMDKADVLFGDDGNDLIYGDGNQPGGNSVVWSLYENHGNDVIDGGSGNDYLIGQGGSDIIFGGTGNDNLWGDDDNDLPGDGNDFLFGGAGEDYLLGGAGDDYLDGGADNDRIWGGAGNDTLDGGDGADTMTGGGGNDVYLNVTSEDTVTDTSGDNVISLGMAGNASTANVSVSQYTTATGETGVQAELTLDSGGTLKLQDIFFSSGKTTVLSAGGIATDAEALIAERLTTDLELTGSDNQDGRIFGAAGSDKLTGGSGNDTLLGYSGNDTLAGQGGNDTLSGQVGDDLLAGGEGNDTYLLNLGDGQDTVIDRQGNNTLRFGQGITQESLRIQHSRYYDVTQGGYIQISQISYGTQGDGVVVQDGLLGAIDHLEFADGSTMTWAEIMAKYPAALTISGGERDDRIIGTRHDDTLYGGTGNDSLAGQAGNDTLFGGASDDTLSGQGGDDLLDGGDGNDTYLFNPGDGFDTLLETSGTDTVVFGSGLNPADLQVSVVHSLDGKTRLNLSFGSDTLSVIDGHLGSIETFRFADGTSLNPAELLAGLDGLTLEGSEQTDVISGSNGNDTLRGQGGGDTLQGLEGNDVLLGGNGNDQLDGGSGDDDLLGQNGDDTLNGGAGRDIYHLAFGSGHDTVHELAGETSLIRLGAGLQAGDFTATQVGDDLMLGIAGTNDKLTLTDYFSNASSWQIETSEGEQSLADFLVAASTPPSQAASVYEQAKNIFTRELERTYLSNLAAQGYQLEADGLYHRYSYRIDGYGSSVSHDVDEGVLRRLTESDSSGIVVTGSNREQVSYNYNSVLIPVIKSFLTGAGGAASQTSSAYFIAPSTTSGFQVPQGSTLVSVQDSTGRYLGTWVHPSQTESLPDGTIVNLYETTSTTRTRYSLQELIAGNSDNLIEVGYGNPAMLDAGAGNDTIDGSGLLYGNAGNDQLKGRDGNDILIGGEGADTLDGGEGADRYFLENEAALDLIVDRGETYRLGGIDFSGRPGLFPTLASALDEVVFPDTISPADLSFSWSDEVLSWPERYYNGLGAGHWDAYSLVKSLTAVLTINWGNGFGVRIAMPHGDQVAGGIERFTFADGTSLSRTQILALAPAHDLDPQLGDNILSGSGSVAGLAGNDLVSGSSGSDFLDGGDGNDQLIGGEGDDRLTGGRGADTLSGGAGNDTLGMGGLEFWGAGNTYQGGTGNDTLLGTVNSDTYLFDVGDGQDSIADYYHGDWHDRSFGDYTDVYYGGPAYFAEAGAPADFSKYEFSAKPYVAKDVLRFGAGVKSTDVSLVREQQDLLIVYSGEGDSIRLRNWYADLPHSIARLEFADGTIWDRTLLDDFDGDAILGTADADNLSGTDFNDVITGLSGADLLVGGTGNDSYVFNAGDGHDVIVETVLPTPGAGYGGNVGSNSITFGSSVLPSDVSVFRREQDLVLVNRNGTDSVTVRDWFSANSLIESVNFADGTRWYSYVLQSQAQSHPMVLHGTESSDYYASGYGDDQLFGLGGDDSLHALDGNDTLDGGSGNDTLDGGYGGDILVGGAGNDNFLCGGGSDTVIFNIGDGADTFEDFGLENDQIVFGNNITLNSLSFRNQNGDLLIEMPYAGDKLTIRGWFDGTTKIAQLVFADGGRIDAEEMTRRAEANVPPELAMPLGQLTATEGTDFAFAIPAGTFVDANAGDTLSYGATMPDGSALPAWLSFNASTGLFSGHPDDAAIGKTSILVTASDPHGAKVSDTLELTVLNVNDAPTGALTISGTPTQNQTLQAVSSLVDADGLGAVSYQWQSSADGTTWNAINGATASSFSLSEAQVGQQVRAVASYTDGHGTLESVSSAATVAVENINDGPTGSVSINGTAAKYQVLTVSNTLADADGMGILAYQWQSSTNGTIWSAIGGATASSFTLTASEVGKQVRAVATYIDGHGTPESVASASTVAVANVNSAPVLTVPLSNQLATEGIAFSLTLPAGSFTDPDAGDTLSYTAKLSGGAALPSWLTFNASTKTLSGMASQTDLGILQVVVTATDSGGLSMNANFQLDVAAHAAVSLTGTAGKDVLTGFSGADTLNGGVGTDQLIGRGGNDTYIVDNIGDVVVEAANEGIDLVQSSVTYTLATNVDNLTLSGTAAINGTGNALDNVLVGNSAANVLTGGAGNDTYYVSTGDTVTEAAAAGTDTVVANVTWTLGSNLENLVLTGTKGMNGTGNALNNVLAGNSAGNTLSGGTGADTMIGGAGNDTYVIDNIGDIVTENLNEGIDLVQSSVSCTLSANVENLTLSGTTAINGTGNALDNVLTGNTAANTLTGGAGNDTLSGDAGADTMIGGTGNDTYVVDNAADVVTETFNEGTDLIQSSVTYTLSANVENLTLTGSAAIKGTGNALDNILIGNSANNTLTGGDGNDTIDGGTGIDTMVGGLGDDVYVVNVSTDIVTEAANAGNDTVRSSVTLTLSTNVENLVLTGKTTINGTGNTLNNLVHGNAAINTLNGGTGNDILEGGDGNDILTDTSGTALFNGGAGSDTITGGAEAEIFLGGLGNDTYTTAGGNDTILFNKGDGQDTFATGGTGSDVISLGGGIAYTDLVFTKATNDLVLKIGATDQITFKNWYAATPSKPVTKLQVLAEAMADFVQGGSNPLLDQKVENFNFAGLAGAFDAARAANTGLTSWALSNALTSFQLAGSDTAALGGDLAYQYGKNGTLAGVGVTPALASLSDANLGTAAQTLTPLSGLQTGSVRLS